MAILQKLLIVMICGLLNNPDGNNMWDTREWREKYIELGMEYLKGKKNHLEDQTHSLTLHQFVGEALIPPVLT